MTIGKTKITAGKFKSRLILTPGTANTHPMGNRQRLALFNMLFSQIKNAIVLDAYAGSGVLGIEALSRGASSVVFVDHDPKAIATIRQNLTDLQITDLAEVIEDKVEHFSAEDRFDLVFVDPPYNVYGPEVMWAVVRHILPAIKAQGMLVLSHPPGHTPVFPGFELTTSRQYAGATLSLFRKDMLQ